MRVIGLCRFSYPASGGFQVEHDSLEARRAYLYDDARMADRFRHFETIALPGLRAQTDPDFTLGIVTGSDLPERWMTRLLDLTEDMPQAVILPLEPGQQHRPAMRAALNQLRGDPDRPCLQFRHDDDDAVSVHFVARLKQTARDCRPLLDRHRLAAIDFNTGWVARPGPAGLEAMRSCNPYWGVALAMWVRGGETRSIFNFNHYKVVANMPTITRNDPDMFLRGQNDFNDSRQKKGVKADPLVPLTEEEEALFASEFAIDCDRVRDVFA